MFRAQSCKTSRAARTSAFTLVEVLVVIGILGILMGALLPALSNARRSAQSVQCSSNIRQLLIASFQYANDNAGYWPPAHLEFLTKNLDRWHGTRTTTASPFNFANSRLKKYLQTDRIKECPSFTPTKISFEGSAGGYGYNSNYFGSAAGDAPPSAAMYGPAEWDREIADRPARMGAIRNITTKIAFADCAMATGPGSLIEYSFVEPPQNTWGETSPSIHFRHNGRANIGWADGHVTSMPMDWTYPTNVYDVENARFNLGFVGPRDNGWFCRK